MSEPLKDEDLAAISSRAADWSVADGEIRNDVERLIAEVRRLHKRVADDTHRITVNSSALLHAKKQASELRCEVERLKALLPDEREQDINAALIDVGRARIGEAWDRLAAETALKEAKAELEATKARLAEIDTPERGE